MKKTEIKGLKKGTQIRHKKKSAFFRGTNEDGKALMKPVKQVAGQSGEAAITGIAAGESVVVDGKQNLRPGSVVVERPKEAKSGASAPAAAGTPASAPAPAGASSRSAL